MNEIIRVENLKKSFGQLDVLKGVSFSMKRGEVLGIIGSSGSGKSTILRCISQLEKVDSGEIWIDGNPCHKKGAHLNDIRKSVGMVYQQFNLFPHYNVIDNITKPLTIVKKVKQQEATLRAIEILEKMKLSDKKYSYPSQLSGGQQQRVAIARALAMESKIILFDEPTSALDPELSYEVLETIKSLSDDGLTMIIVTHHINFVKQVSDRVIFIDEGRICEEGIADKVITNPENERTKVFLNRMKEVF